MICAPRPIQCPVVPFEPEGTGELCSSPFLTVPVPLRRSSNLRAGWSDSTQDTLQVGAPFSKPRLRRTNVQTDKDGGRDKHLGAGGGACDWRGWVQSPAPAGPRNRYPPVVPHRTGGQDTHTLSPLCLLCCTFPMWSSLIFPIDWSSRYLIVEVCHSLHIVR